MEKKALFEDTTKYCAWCKRPLPKECESELCGFCIELDLFRRVKEYVRENEVNEYDVSLAFHIPLRKVKTWIREGRLEYREDMKKLEHVFCVRCGKPIQSGMLCAECNRFANGIKGGFEAHKEPAPEAIRFYDKQKKK